MIEHIQELETLARRLEAGPNERRNWNEAVQSYADAFLDRLPQMNAYLAPDREEEKPLPAIPEQGRPIDDLLLVLEQQVDRAGINPASGFHFGYVPGGGLFPTALGDYLAAATNRYSGIFFASPGAVRVENQLIRWMCSFCGYPPSALGNLSSGGSIANLIAITTARDSRNLKAADFEHSVVYLTAQTHHCVGKALKIAGMGEALLRYVPMDERFRMDARQLQQMIREDRAAGLLPFLIVASAGTTDTGAIDPLDQIADVAAQENLWYHVDAAYGGFFLLVDELRPRFKGIERSDSIAIDPHKGLFLSYGSGAVLVRNVPALYRAHHYQGNYMQDALPDDHEWSPADLSPELTRHFRGMRIWLPLQLYGLEPFRAALLEKVYLCRYFFEKIQEMGFETGPEPDLSILIFRYRTSSGNGNDFNARLLSHIRESGRVFLSSTTIDGLFWFRMAVMSFRSHLAEVDACIHQLKLALQFLMAEEAQLETGQKA